MSRRFESYVIIGGGIMGLCTAWALARRGVTDITLVEQSSIPNQLGASGDEHRIIRRAYGAYSAYGFMISDAFGAWDQLWQDLNEKHLDMRGFAILSRQQGDEGAEYIAGLERDGFSFQELNNYELDRQFPFVSQEGLSRAIYSEEGGVLYSNKIAMGLKELLENAGVKLVENTQINRVDTENGKATVKNGATFNADHFIVTAGAWAETLLPDQTKPLLPRQTYAVFLKPPPQYLRAWQSAPPFLDVGDQVDGYVLPPGNGCDLKFGSGLTRAKFDLATLAQDVSKDEAEFLRSAFSRAFLDIEDYEILRTRRCAYTFTSDERFWARQEGRLTLLSACSGHGYKFGSLIGLKLADSILDNEFDAFADWLTGFAR